MISLVDGLQCAYNSSMKEKTPLELEKENRELKEKIDKAIEYIKENACYGIQEKCCLDDLNYNECDELLEILGGNNE